MNRRVAGNHGKRLLQRIGLPRTCNKIAMHVEPAGAAHGSEDGEDDDADVAPVDISLDEAKRILMDYARLWNNGKGIAGTKPGVAPAK